MKRYKKREYIYIYYETKIKKGIMAIFLNYSKIKKWFLDLPLLYILANFI